MYTSVARLLGSRGSCLGLGLVAYRMSQNRVMYTRIVLHVHVRWWRKRPVLFLAKQARRTKFNAWPVCLWRCDGTLLTQPSLYSL